VGSTLAVSPYDGWNFNTGRETFLLPASWRNGFPIILEQGKAIPTVNYKANLESDPLRYTGNFAVYDNFSTSSELSNDWVFLRNYEGNLLSFDHSEGLKIELIGKNIKQVTNPAFISRRQCHLKFETEMEMKFTPTKENEIAGFVIYQDENHNYEFGKTIYYGQTSLIVEKNQGNSQIVAVLELPQPLASRNLQYKIKGENELISFYFSFDGGSQWITVAESQDSKILSTLTAGGFQGAMIGLYASHNHNDE
jgi:alpha-N-arabinofuranosidase